MRSFPASNESLFMIWATATNAGNYPWFPGGGGIIGGLVLQAWSWIVERCNAPDVGYSQNYRNEQTVNGITYYDCSSLIWYALLYAGFEIDRNAWPFVTQTMGGILKGLGFTEIPCSDPNYKPQKADILVRNNSYGYHTEMMYDETVSMGAHTSNAPLSEQVSINSSPVAVYKYDFAYRFPFSGGDFVIGGNSEYFGDPSAELCGNDSRALNNATIIYNFFKSQGWTTNAIAALCGNIQQESTFNPALIEIGGTGHGLVQWTPPSNLYDVLNVLYGASGDWEDGVKQLNVIYAEYQQSSGIKDWGIEGQWYSTSSYPMSWATWSRSTEDSGYLAMAFQANYERPAAIHPERQAYARAWYNYFTNL